MERKRNGGSNLTQRCCGKGVQWNEANAAGYKHSGEYSVRTKMFQQCWTPIWIESTLNSPLIELMLLIESTQFIPCLLTNELNGET